MCVYGKPVNTRKYTIEGSFNKNEAIGYVFYMNKSTIFRLIMTLLSLGLLNV